MATYYVSPTGSNTAPYDTWAKAATTIATAAAYGTASGSIIEIDGGLTGTTYNEKFSWGGNGVTIQGSYAAGHNGLVTIDGTGTGGHVITINRTTPVLKRVKIINAPSTFYGIFGNTGTGALIEDVIFSGNDAAIKYQGASWVFNRVTISGCTSASGSVQTATTSASAVWNYCIIKDNEYGILSQNGSASKHVFNNCIISGNNRFAAATATASNDLVFNNCIFTGNALTIVGPGPYYIFRCDVGSITCNNCDILSNGYRNANLATGAGTVTYNNCISRSSKFTKYKNLSYTSISLDDVDSLDNFYYLAPYMEAAGFRGTLAIDTQGNSQSSTISAAQWTKIRDLVSRGHEIASHTRSHCNMAASTPISIAYSNGGNTATATIAITGTTGTLTLASTDAADNHTIDISLGGSYESMLALKTQINTFAHYTATISSATYNNIKSFCLAPATVSLNGALTLNATTFYDYEIAGPKADLETHIPGYIVKTFVCPFNGTSDAVASAIKNAGYICGTTDDQVTGNYLMSSVNIYKIWRTLNYQVTTKTTDEAITSGTHAFCSWMNQVGGFGVLYGHSANPALYPLEYNQAQWLVHIQAYASVAGIRILPIGEAATLIKEAGTSTDGITYSVPTSQTPNYHLRPSSPCINAGTTIEGLATDFDGNKLPPSGSGFVPDIGAYDSYVGSEGTILCGVYLPWDSSAIPLGMSVLILTPHNSWPFLYMRRTSDNIWFIGLNDGALIAKNNTNFIAGYYILIAQYSARTSRMRVGLFNPVTGALTWGSWAAYRGFFPIYGTGDQQRLRYYYGGSQFPIHITSTAWYNQVLSDNEILGIIPSLTKYDPITYIVDGNGNLIVDENGENLIL